MGLIMLPTMLRFGYDPRLAAGTVAATATLAQIFPPATVLVLLGDQLGNAYQAAQLVEGYFRAALAHGQRSVRWRAGARLCAGRPLPDFSDRGRGAVPESVTARCRPMRKPCAASSCCAVLPKCWSLRLR